MDTKLIFKQHVNTKNWLSVQMYIMDTDVLKIITKSLFEDTSVLYIVTSVF